MPNEICILCGKETNVDINTHVDYRYGYVEGAGQCCKECYNKTSNIEEDYVTRTMKNRTTLLTISAEDILENITALIADLKKAKPASSKGQYLKKISLSTTMGPGLPIDISSIVL